MAEYREVVTVDSDSSSNSTLLAVFIIAVVALLGIGLMYWQPWAATAPTNTTNNITIPDQNKPDTTIINPPSTTIVTPPPSTNTDIRTNDPNAAPTTTTTTTGG